MIRRLIILLLIVGCVFAQQYNVVVILKDGSEIHGIIIEQKPNATVIINKNDLDEIIAFLNNSLKFIFFLFLLFLKLLLGAK